MKKDNFVATYESIERFEHKLGEVFYDAFLQECNTTYEIAKSIVNTFNKCHTEQEFAAAEAMLIAICSYSMDDLFNKIKERDTNN